MQSEPLKSTGDSQVPGIWRSAGARFVGRLSLPRWALLLCVWTLALGQGFSAIGCGSDKISGGSGSGQSSTVAGVLGTHDLGAVAFDLYRGTIAREAPSAARDARLAALDGRRDGFVQAINDIVNVRTVQNAAQTADAFFALIDDGTLPVLTEHVAATLSDLADDPQALDAIVALLSAGPANGAQSTGLPPKDLVALLGRMFNYSETERLWRAVAGLISENDGVDANGQPNSEPTLVQDLLAFAREGLQGVTQAGPAPTQVGAALNDLFAALSEDAVVNGTFDFGAPEWIVRVDGRGLPRVAQDASGNLLAPFVDRDGDGLADVNADSAFVDAAGKVVDRPTLRPGNVPATDPGYDSFGRALEGGQLLYVYADAKRTNLALFMQLGGELIQRDVHARGRALIEALLGTPTAGGGYSPDNPLVDLLSGSLTLLEPDAVPGLLRALADLIRTDPDLAERLLVTLSRAWSASSQAAGQSSFVGISDPRVKDLFDDLLPLLDDVFEAPATGGASTARQVLETLGQLNRTAPDFGHQLAPLLRFSRVEREAVADADRNSIDEARSTLVDRAQPSQVGGLDNRSSLHQLLDLLARADGCSFFGRNLAVLILDLMADQSPSTVGTLVGLVNAFPGLSNLVCSGVSGDLQSLDALAKAGALDALLPLAKAFKDRGETDLLVSILVRIQQSYEVVIRPVEEDLVPFLESGLVEALLELSDQARQVRDPQTNQSVADLLASTLEFLVDDDGSVLDARGNAVPSRAHLLFVPLTELEVELRRMSLGTEASQLVDSLFEVFLERVSVGGVERLRNGSLIPLTARAAEAFAQALPADAATRRSELSKARTALRDAVASKHGATLLSLLRTIDRSPSRALITQGLVDLLTPRATSSDDTFGAVAKVGVVLLQAPHGTLAVGSLSGLTPFLSGVLDPSNPLLLDAVRAFQRLLTADQGQTVLNLLRAALNPPQAGGDAPAVTLIDVFSAVQAAGASGSGSGIDRAALRETLRGTVDFLRDRQSGLPYLYELIRTRQVR